MTRFAPASTAWRSTLRDAIAVVTTPEMTVAGSPALMVSTVSVFHSTPIFFLIRSMTSAAERGATADTRRVDANGAAIADTVSAPNSRRDRGVMVRRSEVLPFPGVAIDQIAYSMRGVLPEWMMHRLRHEHVESAFTRTTSVRAEAGHYIRVTSAADNTDDTKAFMRLL
jgi:hypothetical protein